MRQDAVNFFKEQPVLQLQTDISQQFQLRTDIGGEVPRVPVARINAAPMRFPELLSQIAEQVGMSWSITGENRDALLSKEIYYVQRNETMLETVLEEISKSSNSFYRIEGDKIVFSQSRDFTTSIPRMDDSQNIIQQGMANLGAEDIFVDGLTGTMTFSADRRAYHAILDLMKSFQEGRDMIVYDFWIIDRTLSDNAGAGGTVDFTGATVETGFGAEGILNAIASGGSDRAVVTGNLGGLGIEATLRFVRSLGQAETVARPTISMLSGSSSRFQSGETSEYIRSVNTDSTDSTTSSGTDVRTLRTGVEIDVEGAHNAGVISSDFELRLSDLIEFQEFDTGEVTLRLPRVSERNVDAHLEARPGDVMILGGIIRDRQDKGQRNLGATDIATSRTATSQKTETIILVRPRLVQIRPTGRAVLPLTKGSNVVGDVIGDELKAQALIKGMAK
jgi:type II secretory pathway component GspD/PulD (secretin)